jgi:mono/diheme cytochrome c family protein
MYYKTLLVIFFIFFLAGCNFSLSTDVTPPPDYATSTPLPDLGNLFPESPSSPSRGKEIYEEECAPCHGNEGLGNGPLAATSSVVVPAIGLKDVSRQAVPMEWYEIISLGNLDRGMPSFIFYNEQQRWDVLAYVESLSTTVDELALGQVLFEENCSTCHGPGGDLNPTADFSSPEFMAASSDISLYRAIAEGGEHMDSFLDALSPDEIWAITSYIRTFAYDLSLPAETPTPEPSPSPVTEVLLTATPSEIDVPSPTPSDSPTLSGIEITGQVTNGSGTGIADGLTATLILYDTDERVVIDTQVTSIQSAGGFRFESIVTDLQTAYWVSVEYQGVSYYSQFELYDGTSTTLDLPVVIYDMTTDWSSLSFEIVHIEIGISDDLLKVSEYFVFGNDSTETIVVETDGTYLPFIMLPDGVSEFESLAPDTTNASFLPALNGIALPPTSDTQFGIVASFSIPYDGEYEFTQLFPIPVEAMSLIVPEGVRIKTDQLSASDPREINGIIYQIFESTDLSSAPVIIKIAGTPGVKAFLGYDQRDWVIIGSGILGLAFLALGIVLYLRDRSAAKLDEHSGTDNLNEESSEISDDDRTSLVDAIIALDEKLKNKDITLDAYRKRQALLKRQLKTLLERERDTGNKDR